MKKIRNILSQENIQKISKQEKMTQLGQTKLASTKEDLIKSIDSLFLKLELAYHYQFYKVFGTDQRLFEAKKLWAESLKKFPSECIDAAVENVIESNDYLPTLTEVIKACSASMGSINIPSPQEAFIEAQKSSSPRQSFPWTHPIIYWTGKEIGWEIINSPNNSNTFQAFFKTYMRLAKELSNGKKFDLIPKDAPEEFEPIDLELLEKLRKKHDL